MNIKRLRSGILLAIVALLLVAACGGSSDTSDEPEGPKPTLAPAATRAPTATKAPEATKTSQATEAAEATEPPATGEEQPAESTQEPEPESESGIPYDVPIVQGALDMVIQEDVGTITYYLEDTDIEQVVDFYVAQMAEAGWESKTLSAIGMMAALVFETEQARVSISLQANNIAKTVNVRLIIIDK